MRKLFICFCILSLFFLPQTAWGANYLNGMLENEQDLLVLGQIVDGCAADGYRLQVVKAFQSQYGTVRYVLPDVPQEIMVQGFGYSYSQPEDFVTPKIGDKVFLSLRKKILQQYQVANGAYLVDSLDPATLRIVAPGNIDDASEGDLTAIGLFIRSDGTKVATRCDPRTRTLFLAEGESFSYDQYQDMLFVIEDRDQLEAMAVGADNGFSFVTVLGFALGGAALGFLIVLSITKRKSRLSPSAWSEPFNMKKE